MPQVMHYAFGEKNGLKLMKVVGNERKHCDATT